LRRKKQKEEYYDSYYQNFIKLADSNRIDIVGHLDLVTKHVETSNFFDSESPKYKQIALDAIRKVFKRCQVFEVNTGAIARGYRTTFYPAPFIMQELKNLGAKMIISSDCHNMDFLNCKFDEALKYILSFGFDCAYLFDGEKFTPFK
jgi:histidinol-phosphatase (PHP family)